MTTIVLPDIFQTAELTNVLNLMPIQYGKLTQMNMFPFVGMAGKVAAISRTNTGLCMVPTSEWCGPPKAANKRGKRDMVFIEVPHTPLEDVVHPCDVMGRPMYDLNSPTGLMTLADEANERMAQMRAKLELTHEYRQVRALFGEVLDTDGTVLEDLYASFGYEPINVVWPLANPNFDLQTACLDLSRKMRKAFKGVYQNVMVMVPPCLFDLIVSNKQARDAYKRCCDTMNANVAGDPRMGFSFGGVTFWEYDAEGCAVQVDANGTATEVNVDFLAPPKDVNGDPLGECVGIAYPNGAPNNYETLGAPPTMTDFIGKKADQMYYASMWPRCHNEGFDLKEQMNLLPIVKQPQALIRIVVGSTTTVVN